MECMCPDCFEIHVAGENRKTRLATVCQQFGQVRDKVE